MKNRCSTCMVMASLLWVAPAAGHANTNQPGKQDGRGASSGALSDDGVANLAAFTQAFGLLRAMSWDTTLGRWELAPVVPRLKGKLAFLAGGATISYGESLLDIVDAYKLGVIVGAPSAGTNGTVVETKLPGGVSISWTGMRVRRHGGGRLFGKGIQPTIMAKPTIAGLAADRDEILEAALDAVAN